MRSLKGRIDRIARQLVLGPLWDGEDPIGLCVHGFFGRGDDEPDIRDQAPPGIQRLVIAVGLDIAVQSVLDGSRHLREELAAMRKTDEWRITQRYPIVCTPDVPDSMNERIAEAAEYRELLGIDEDATESEVIDAALEIVHNEGLMPAEIDWLRGLLTHKPKNRTPGVATSN
jgi:hypothetical protein